MSFEIVYSSYGNVVYQHGHDSDTFMLDDFLDFTGYSEEQAKELALTVVHLFDSYPEQPSFEELDAWDAQYDELENKENSINP